MCESAAPDCPQPLFPPRQPRLELEQERKWAGRGCWNDCPGGLWGCRGNEGARGQVALQSCLFLRVRLASPHSLPCPSAPL